MVSTTFQRIATKRVVIASNRKDMVIAYREPLILPRQPRQPHLLRLTVKVQYGRRNARVLRVMVSTILDTHFIQSQFPPSFSDPPITALAPATNTLRRTSTRIDFSLKILPQPIESLPKKTKTASPLSQTKRKPTLIRNLGGVGAPKGIFISYQKSNYVLIAHQ